MPGIAKSINSRSILVLASSAPSAALPLDASITLYPLSRSNSAVISRSSPLSSTSRMFAALNRSPQRSHSSELRNSFRGLGIHHESTNFDSHLTASKCLEKADRHRYEDRDELLEYRCRCATKHLLVEHPERGEPLPLSRHM